MLKFLTEVLHNCFVTKIQTFLKVLLNAINPTTKFKNRSMINPTNQITLRVRMKGGGTKPVFWFSSPPPYIFYPHFGAVKNIVGLSKLKNKLIFTFLHVLYVFCSIYCCEEIHMLYKTTLMYLCTCYIIL